MYVFYTSRLSSFLPALSLLIPAAPFLYKRFLSSCAGLIMSMHTKGRATATQYSGVKEGAPLPMILELEVGSVDRGASIRDFSQYPDEDEYLFVPLCFVAPAGPQRMEVTDKSVLHITPVRDARVGPALPPSFQASFHLQL
jgi:hypothetical protein